MADGRSNLAKALSRLFSSNMVVRNLGDKNLKIVDPSNIQSVASKYYDTRYKGLRSQSGGGRMGRSGRQGQTAPGSNIGYLSSRTGLYRDYETMDTDSIISAALDMYADESVVENEYGEVLTINADDQEVKEILHNLFYDILDIEFNLRWWVRTLAKYGDCYLKLNISEEYGIINAQPMSPFEIVRIEGVEDNPYGVKFKYEGLSDQPEYEYWEVAHFRLLSDGNYLPYGKSILEGARRTWKQLCLHKNTRISTSEGYKKIENVESGDIVYSFDYEGGRFIETEVESCERMADQDTYTVSTENKEVKATDRHGFLVYNDGEYEYKPVEEISVGDDYFVLYDDGGYELEVVENIEFFEEDSETYDLEVDHELHNFVADGVVSHNTLMEDAMLVHRVMRAPEKRIFRIDVGNIEPDAVDTFMDQIIQEIQKTPLIDPETGEYNLKYNMMNMIEDYYLPVRGGDSGTEIDTLSGLEYNAIEDIEYLRKKMMTALRIPNAFLGYEEELEGKATLAQQSIKFANQVKYIQKIVVSELKKIAIIHLFTLGIRDERLVNFSLSLSNPSTVRESEYLELLSEKMDLARTITELPLFSTTWIYKNLFDLSDEEIRKQRELKEDDKKRAFQYSQIETEGNDPVKTGQSFGTPHDLAMSGSADVKPVSLEKKEKEEKKKEAVKNMQKSKSNMDDPLGKDKAFDTSNISGEEPDYEQRYRDREGLPVDHITPERKKELIQESLSDLEDSGKFAAKLRNEDFEDSSDDMEGTFMDEDVIDMDI